MIGLDDALDHFGFKQRGEDDAHDALVDARLAAKVYMEASMLPPLKSSLLGHVNEEKQ